MDLLLVGKGLLGSSHLSQKQRESVFGMLENLVKDQLQFCLIQC